MTQQAKLGILVAASCTCSHKLFLRAEDVCSQNSSCIDSFARKSSCADSYVACFRWAAEGNCAQLPKFMDVACPLSCGSCTDQDAFSSKHQTADPCVPVLDAVGRGSIAEKFAAALTLHEFKPSVLSRDPFIVMLDDFAGREEVAEIAALADKVGFGASGSSCGFNQRSCNSTSMSCIPVAGGVCWDHEAMQKFEARMQAVLGVPMENCEPLRFFRYRAGETFGLHHDAQGQTLAHDIPGGPRIWSLYVFLSEVGQGGSFDFPMLNLSVMPKPGRAILWPHLLDDDLMTPDQRTQHVGGLVIEGEKFGVNLHAHRNNLRTWVMAGCETTGKNVVAHNFHYQRVAGSTVLHDVVGLSASGAVPSLLAARAAVNDVDSRGITPLQVATGRNMVEAVRLLLAARAIPDAGDKKGQTALHTGSWQGRAEAVRVLLTARVAPGITDAKGNTPLHSAARHGQAITARMLLEAGAIVDARSNDDATPLRLAAWRGQLEASRVLLEARADVSLVYNNGDTVLHTVAAEGHPDMLQLLLDARADPDAPGERGITSLHLAAMLGRIDVARTLLDAGAAVSAADRSGATPIHLAAQQGHVEAAQVLIKAGAPLDVVNGEGSTPLHIAAWQGHEEMSLLLLERRSGLNARDGQGSTPLEIALSYGHTALEGLLQPDEL